MSHGYTSLSTDTFLGFGATLDAAPWSTIHELPAATAEERAAWIDASWLEVQKATLRLGIRLLSGALAGDRSPVHQADEAWDSVERRLHFALAEREAGQEQDVVGAARRLRTVLLKGGAVVQTTLAWRAEVDFGRSQLQLAAEPQVAADLKTCGLEERVGQIKAATDALEAALEANPAQARHISTRQGHRQCAQTFDEVHDALARRLLDTPAGAARDRLQTLLDTLTALLPSAPRP